MNALLGRQMVVNLQTNDGYAYGGQVIGVDLSMERGYSGSQAWELTMKGIGALQVVQQVVKDYENKFTSQEWRCEWCGSVQPRMRLACQKCGGPRSFLYELMNHAASTWTVKR